MLAAVYGAVGRQLRAIIRRFQSGAKVPPAWQLCVYLPHFRQGSEGQEDHKAKGHGATYSKNDGKRRDPRSRGPGSYFGSIEVIS